MTVARSNVEIRFFIENAAYRNPEAPELLEHPEIANSVREIADAIFSGAMDGAVIDPNGNHVGYWCINHTEEG